MKKILYFLIPLISFLSIKFGRKVILYTYNQDDIHSQSYIYNIKLLRKCYFHSSGIFLIILIIILTIIILKYNLEIIIDNYLYFISLFIVGSNTISQLRFHNYLFTSPTKDDKNAKNIIIISFYIISIFLTLIKFLSDQD